MQAEPAEASLPLGPRRVIPKRPVERPAATAVGRLEERRGRHPRPQDALLDAGLDDPDAGDRGVGAAGKSRPLGLGPLALGVVGPVEVRSELAVGDRGVVGAGAPIAAGVFHHLAAKLAGQRLELAAAWTAQHEEPLLGADEDLGRRFGSTGDRLHDVHLVALAHRIVEPGRRGVDKDVDVLANVALIVEHPSTQLGPLGLQPPQQAPEVGAQDPELALAAQPGGERSGQNDGRHALRDCRTLR